MAISENAPHLRSQPNEFRDFGNFCDSKLYVYDTVLSFFGKEVKEYIDKNGDYEDEQFECGILMKHLQTDKPFLNKQVIDGWIKKIMQTPFYLRGVELNNIKDYLLSNTKSDNSLN